MSNHDHPCPYCGVDLRIHHDHDPNRCAARSTVVGAALIAGRKAVEENLAKVTAERDELERRLAARESVHREEVARLLEPEAELRRLQEINAKMCDSYNHYLGETVRLESELADFRVELGAALVARRAPIEADHVNRAAAAAFKRFFGLGDASWKELDSPNRERWVTAIRAAMEA